MAKSIFATAYGRVELPDAGEVLVDRLDGGHLTVWPSREVWERSELTPAELAGWGELVSATGRAMLDCLPQLAGGCINYWEAGNWALHQAAEPPGPKAALDYRRVHHHLFGRSRQPSGSGWLWGEAPEFPRYNSRMSFARGRR